MKNGIVLAALMCVAALPAKAQKQIINTSRSNIKHAVAGKGDTLKAKPQEVNINTTRSNVRHPKIATKVDTTSTTKKPDAPSGAKPVAKP